MTQGKSTNARTPDIEVLSLKPAISADGGEHSFVVRITPPTPKSVERRRINLSLVLDRSGSMGGAPLENAKKAALAAVRMLEPSDRVSVVAYDDQVSVIVGSTKVSEPRWIERAIESIRRGGTTALHAGWLEGTAQAASYLDPTALNRVVLLTDGLANVGETNTDLIANDVRELRDNGVSTSALGLGRQFNEDLLEAMAEAGDGNFYLIEDPGSLEAVFQAELLGLSATVGTDVTMSVHASGSGTTVSRVLNQFGRKDGALRLPNLIAGLPLEIGVVVETPRLDEGSAQLGSLRLAWNDAQGQLFEATVPVDVDVVDAETYAAMAEDEEVASILTELRAARAREDAIAALDRGDRVAANKHIGTAKGWLQDRPDSARMRREIAGVSAVESAFHENDDAMARKRMKAQAHRSRKSYRHEDLFDAHAGQEARFEIDRPDGSKAVILLVRGDITEERVDAIVNPTNPKLFGTGQSVDGTVHRKGGMELTRACREVGFVDIGDAVVTPGFHLAAEYVIHTAVPVWEGGAGDERIRLANCYISAFDLANRMNLRTVSVPAIGAGTNGFPVHEAARVATEEIVKSLRKDGMMETVRIVLFNSKHVPVYRNAVAKQLQVA